MAFFRLVLVTLCLATVGARAAVDIPSHIASLSTADVLVSFDSVRPLLAKIEATRHVSRETKLQDLHDTLTAYAEETQAEAQALLRSSGVKYESFWINNQIHVSAISQALLKALVDLPNVRGLRLNEQVPLVSPVSGKSSVRVRSPGTLAEWGIENIQADEVWVHPNGTRGEGVRVCTIDTGVRGTHEALSPSFLGEYGWYDPSAKTPTPNDGNGHGTHTTGTIAGQNGIGVAPGAKWTACKGCATSSCSNSDLIGCGQWVACPTLTDGVSQPNCSLAPHIVSNSWAGGSGDSWYDDVIVGWHVAGVIPVFANGNAGSSCNTAQSPADSLARVIAVGATTSSNGLASFSSRGPSDFGMLKPNIAAPGQDVRSAYNTGDAAYSNLSGTSMACPHVAGVVALLKSLRPELKYGDVEGLLYGHSDTNVVPDNQHCAGVDDSTFPNHSYGSGKVNALRVVLALQRP